MTLLELSMTLLELRSAVNDALELSMMLLELSFTLLDDIYRATRHSA